MTCEQRFERTGDRVAVLGLPMTTKRACSHTVDDATMLYTVHPLPDSVAELCRCTCQMSQETELSRVMVKSRSAHASYKDCRPAFLRRITLFHIDIPHKF